MQGRAQDLHRRFADHTLALWREMALDVQGFWNVADDPHRIVYIVRFGSVAEAQAHWAEFSTDPRWLDIKAASEQDGPLIESISVTYLSSPDYITS
uniref:Protein converting hydride meisenheimer complex to product x n=1 Tax=Nocardioides sp. (strain JS1661) TaxID=1517491 RepID=A0A089P8Q4_NOCS1|nr:protein converting hydride meisenheimer complex to product x [Nocardioides sp. JS1661]